jgi:5-methylcytosine-specific restriction endonuclease McrA
MYKSARSKATAISKRVKNIVYERDNGTCIVCGKPGLPEAHYISRQRGGLGIEQNIVTLCRDCHYLYDYGDKAMKETIRYTIKEYLTMHYPDLKEKNLIFKKWSDF